MSVQLGTCRHPADRHPGWQQRHLPRRPPSRSSRSSTQGRYTRQPRAGVAHWAEYAKPVVIHGRLAHASTWRDRQVRPRKPPGSPGKPRALPCPTLPYPGYTAPATPWVHTPGTLPYRARPLSGTTAARCPSSAAPTGTALTGHLGVLLWHLPRRGLSAWSRTTLPYYPACSGPGKPAWEVWNPGYSGPGKPRGKPGILVILVIPGPGSPRGSLESWLFLVLEARGRSRILVIPGPGSPREVWIPGLFLVLEARGRPGFFLNSCSWKSGRRLPITAGLSPMPVGTGCPGVPACTQPWCVPSPVYPVLLHTPRLDHLTVTFFKQCYRGSARLPAPEPSGPDGII